MNPAKSLTTATENHHDPFTMSYSRSFGDVYTGDSVQVISASEGPKSLPWTHRVLHRDTRKVGLATTGVCLSLLDEPQSSSKAIPLNPNTMYSVLHDQVQGVSRVLVTNLGAKSAFPPIYATGGSRSLAYIALTDQASCTTHELPVDHNRLIVKTDLYSYTAWPVTRAEDARLHEGFKKMSIVGDKVGLVTSQTS